MQAAPPQLVNALKHADDLGPDFAAYIDRIFGPFRFEDIELLPAVEPFEGRLELTIGDRAVHLVEVGPAHTDGDAIVHVPDAGVVFTGDILFVEGTPIVWAGPFSNWLGACDRLLELDAPTLVPGHGPVTDASGVRDVKRYLTYVRDEARARFDAGMDAEQAADDIDLSDFAGWGDPERIAVNVATPTASSIRRCPSRSGPSCSCAWRAGRAGISRGRIGAWPSTIAPPAPSTPASTRSRTSSSPIRTR